MRVLLLSAGMLLRRRSCLSGPLLLLGLGLCLYQTLMLAWNRVRSGQRGRSREPIQRVAVDEETRRILSFLEAAQVSSRDVTESVDILMNFDKVERVAVTVMRILSTCIHMSSLINKILIISTTIFEKGHIKNLSHSIKSRLKKFFIINADVLCVSRGDGQQMDSCLILSWSGDTN